MNIIKLFPKSFRERVLYPYLLRTIITLIIDAYSEHETEEEDKEFTKNLDLKYNTDLLISIFFSETVKNVNSLLPEKITQLLD